MTTIIVVAVVALVFFVTVCVVTFMVWKRNAEIRTESIKAIEYSIGDMVQELSGIRDGHAMKQSIVYPEPRASSEPRISPNSREYSEPRNYSDHRAYAKAKTYEEPQAYTQPNEDREDHEDKVTIYERKETAGRRFNKFAPDKANESRGGRIKDDDNQIKTKDPFGWLKAEASGDDSVTVFRPKEKPGRKLKWTEISDLDEPQAELSKDLQAERPKAPQAELPKEQEGTGEIRTDEDAKPAGAHIKEDVGPVKALREEEKEEKEEENWSIDLSFIDLEDLSDIDTDDVEFFESNVNMQTDYNTGKSGRKYTAEELEALIKE